MCIAWARMLTLATALVACLSLAESAQAGLKDVIAERFGVEADAFVLNFPPRPGCLPGSIFTDDLRVPITRTRPDDTALERGPLFQFSADIGTDLEAGAGAGVSGWFGVAAKASATSTIVLDFKDAHTVEILGPELKKRVLADTAALAAPRKPFAVLRAFEGKITVTIAKKNAASAEAWASVKQATLDAKLDARVGADDKIVIAVGEPFVFGFEVVQVNYFATHLGTRVDNATLTPVPADLFAR